jgi:hypothetical protein
VRQRRQVCLFGLSRSILFVSASRIGEAEPVKLFQIHTVAIGHYSYGSIARFRGNRLLRGQLPAQVRGIVVFEK